MAKEPKSPGSRFIRRTKNYFLFKRSPERLATEAARQAAAKRSAAAKKAARTRKRNAAKKRRAGKKR